MHPKPVEEIEISWILQELIRRREITVAELARRVNLPQPTIQRIVSGTYKNPRLTTLEPIANYFGVTINQLRGFEPLPFLGNRKKSITSIPLLNNSQLDNWPNRTNNKNNYIICDNNLSENSFAIYMPDCSMEPTIPKGSILLVDPKRLPQHKSYIILRLQDYPEIIVRQLITDAKNHFIRPLSPELSHLKMSEIKKTDTIVGVVVEIRHICEEY